MIRRAAPGDVEVTGLAALDVRQGLQHDAPAARIVALIVRFGKDL